jgi:hypothetical protein
MLERLEKRPGTAPAVFPPPIFTGSASVLWFRVSLPPPRENTSEGLYIWFVGQPRQSEIKTDSIGATRLKHGLVRPSLAHSCASSPHVGS